MSDGLSRFTFYTDRVKELLSKAREEENPALWLFSNNARTPFFMLEALSKLYEGMHNAGKFGKLKDHFKLIEDGIGQIDYYNSLSLALNPEKKIPEVFKKYITGQLSSSVEHLNEVLLDKEWLSYDSRRIRKIVRKLEEADWLKPRKEIESIAGFYEKSVASIGKFVSETGYHFDNVEEDVHELRRRLRWLSIYPQALQGAVQYAVDRRTAVHLKKYLTKEIVSSPYNKFPAVGSNTYVLLLNKNYFLALSWIIAELGSLKDEGLLLTGLCEAIKNCSSCSEEEALEKAYTLLGTKQRKIQEILDDAELITKRFFKEENLQKMLAGIKNSSV